MTQKAALRHPAVQELRSLAPALTEALQVPLEAMTEIEMETLVAILETRQRLWTRVPRKVRRALPKDLLQAEANLNACLRRDAVELLPTGGAIH